MSLNMKTQALFLGAVLSLLSFAMFAQKNAPVEPWFENTDRKPFQQGLDGVLLMEIKNTGTDINDCKTKAKQQAVFAVIFLGYAGANNIPAAPAISPTGEALYYEKTEYFNKFLTSPSQYGLFVPTAEVNPNKPASKIDKKTIEANIIVTVEVDRLRKSLEDQSIIKSAKLFGVQPTVLIVPSERYMDEHKLYTDVDNQGRTERVYNYLDACKKMGDALNIVAEKFGGTAGTFEVKNMATELKNIATADAIKNASNESKKESSTDIFFRVLKADLWLSVHLDEEVVENGLKTKCRATLNGVNPYTGVEEVIGKTIPKESVSSDKFSLMTSAMQGAVDDLRPKVLAHFQNIATNGITGKISFSLLDGVDFNFDTEIETESDEFALKELLTRIVKANAKVKSEDNATGTILEFTASIPFEYKDDFTGSMEKNSFTNVGNKIKSQVKKLGYTAKTEPRGLGRVEIVITGKKE
jgi:hypothetical protein